MLNDLILPSRAHQRWLYSGIDSPDKCLDRQHFDRYPYTVSYDYNSRGFRDLEWPNNLQDAVWCLGDSFTVGLGSPVKHTWPYRLEQRSGCRCINISMDGASNNWIARRAIDIITEVNPGLLVIHWSYLHRRELDYAQALVEQWHAFYQAIKDPKWPAANLAELPLSIQQEITQEHRWPWASDESRLVFSMKTTEQEDIDNTIDCIRRVTAAGTTKIIHTFIPEFAKNAAEFFEQAQLADYIATSRLDLARDGHHYDLITAQDLADQICARLSAASYDTV